MLRVGYQSLRRSVTVTNGQTTTEDFSLGVAVAQLEEVVTTATGAQRKVGVGNAVSTLGDVGKRVDQSEISNITDLMVAKAPGVSILPSPVLGGAPTIRMRGVSSISLTNAPIWIVDGVRYNTNNPSTSSGQTPVSLFNSLSPEEIEDIEIVKGPSAATLYGTNAANGVILITTKKGRAGATHWNWVAESRTIDDRTHYQAQYANFGHTPTNPGKEIRCQLPVMQTSQFSIAQGTTCISDSLTHYDPFSDPSNTMIGLGRGSLFGANVAGGNDAVRFFASANIDNEYGPIQMPAPDIQFYQDSLHTQVTDAMLHPRSQQRINFRTNISAALSPKFDLNATAGFGKSDNAIEPDNSLLISTLYLGQAGYGYKGCPKGTETTGCGLDKPYVDATGFPLHDYNSFAPGSVMQFITPVDVQRTTGSLDANWRPFAWMQNAGTVGIDLADADAYHICRLNECPQSGATSRSGNVSDQKRNFRTFSAKLASTASWQARGWLNLKTSVGADYTNVESDSALLRLARGLAPGGVRSLGATATIVCLFVPAACGASRTARLLCAGAGRVARPVVHHRRGASGPEQRIRYEVPEHQLSEGERVVARVGRIVLPEVFVAEQLPSAQRLWRERCAAWCNGGVAAVLGGDGRAWRRPALCSGHRYARLNSSRLQPGQRQPQAWKRRPNSRAASRRICSQSPTAHRLHVLQQEDERTR